MMVKWSGFLKTPECKEEKKKEKKVPLEKEEGKTTKEEMRRT